MTKPTPHLFAVLLALALGLSAFCLTAYLGTHAPDESGAPSGASSGTEEMDEFHFEQAQYYASESKWRLAESELKLIGKSFAEYDEVEYMLGIIRSHADLIDHDAYGEGF